MAAPDKEADAARAVRGGEHVDVVHRDGRRETVLLRELTYRQLGEFATYVRDDRMADLIEMCVGQENGWLDKLTLESSADLAQACLKANFPLALKFAKQDQLLGVKLAGMLAGMARVANLSDLFPPLSAKSPEPVSSASAAETGSESST